MTQMNMPPGGFADYQSLRPHRGTMLLVFGILGLVICPIFGIVAWVMGNSDLREIAAGRMDPTGEGLTRAGKIIGMIATILALIGLLIWILIVFVFGAAIVAGASSSY